MKTTIARIFNDRLTRNGTKTGGGGSSKKLDHDPTKDEGSVSSGTSRTTTASMYTNKQRDDLTCCSSICDDNASISSVVFGPSAFPEDKMAKSNRSNNHDESASIRKFLQTYYPKTGGAATHNNEKKPTTDMQQLFDNINAVVANNVPYHDTVTIEVDESVPKVLHGVSEPILFQGILGLLMHCMRASEHTTRLCIRRKKNNTVHVKNGTTEQLLVQCLQSGSILSSATTLTQELFGHADAPLASVASTVQSKLKGRYGIFEGRWAHNKTSGNNNSQEPVQSILWFQFPYGSSSAGSSFDMSLRQEHLVLVQSTASTTSKQEQEAKTTTLDKNGYNLAQAVALVKEYMRCMNGHDLDGMKETVVKNNKVTFEFIDVTLDWNGWDHEVRNLFRAFPDFNFDYGRLEATTSVPTEEEPKQEDILILHDFQASGTHTAAPYAFGPFPEIEPQGTKVKNDPETLHFYFANDDGDDENNKMKIRKVLFVTRDRLTGPPGIYTQLGGFPLQ